MRLKSVAMAKPPGIEAVSSTSVTNRTGSIGQYGAGSQVAQEIGAKQDSRAPLSAASGRHKSERVDTGWASSKGRSLGALRKGMGGWRCAATSVLPPATCEGLRRERLGPRILDVRPPGLERLAFQILSSMCQLHAGVNERGHIRPACAAWRSGPSPPERGSSLTSQVPECHRRLLRIRPNQGRALAGTLRSRSKRSGRRSSRS